MLSEAEERFLRRARARQRYLLIIGAVLAVAGGLYMAWGVRQLQVQTPLDEPAFDRPISRLALLVLPRLRQLDQIRPATRLEAALLAEVKEQTGIIGRLVVVVLRLLIGSFVCTAGLVIVTVGLSERPLLRIIARLHGAASIR
jgi:hypothetical protein